MSSYETVSIIMPTFNAASYISYSIISVIEQSYNDWHLYIIDDGSTDNTAHEISNFTDLRITYVMLPINSGVANARNIGIKMAKGKFIAFLDSDDIWEKEKLSLQIPLLEKGYDVVCSNYAIFKNEPKKIIGSRTAPQQITYSRLLRGNCIGNLTGIYNRERLGKCLQEECGHEDYLMWLQLVKLSGSAYCIQKNLARYRVTEHSVSSNKLKAAFWQWNIYRKKLKLNILSSIYYWCNYSFYAFMHMLKMKFHVNKSNLIHKR